MRCVLCHESWPEATASCTCGFDFTANDPRPAIERLKRDARRGNNVWRRGFITMIALPITFAIDSFPLGMMLGAAQLVLAITWIVMGLARADAANRKLETAKELRQLPEARLLR